MTKIIVAGAAGRMGARIMRAAMDGQGLEVVAAFERPGHPDLGRDAGLVAGLGEMRLPLSGDLAKIVEAGEVVVDFTVPEATLGHLETAAAAGRSMVIGTTGFSAEQKARIETLAKKVSLVMAPNMSVGVNLLFKIVGDVARILGSGYDVEIIEAHHRFKKDAPSGTAVRLAEVVAEALGREMGECGVYGREGLVGERTAGEIGVLAVRAGDIVGEHTVMYGGIGERVEITHRAHSRDNLCHGRGPCRGLGRRPAAGPV